MIDEKIAAMLAKDLLAMGRAPDMGTADGKAIFRLIVARLAEGADSKGHAIRAVRQIVDTETFFPPPSAIVAALDSTPRDTEARSTLRACPICQGDGWVSVDGPHSTTAAVPCNHSGEIPPNLGVVMPASVSRMYLRDQAMGDARRAAWVAAGKPALGRYKGSDLLAAVGGGE